jgi:hypothetical protein
MLVNSVYRQFADRRPRIVKHCADIPLLRQAKTSCRAVNVCGWTAEIAFAMSVYPSRWFFLYYHVHFNFFVTFLRHWLRVPQRGKWTAVFNTLNVVLLDKIRSTSCRGSARYSDDLFKNTSTLAHKLCLVLRFQWEARNTKHLFANSPQTRT